MKIMFSSDHHHHPFSSFATMGSCGVSNRLREGLDVEDEIAGIATQWGCDLHVRLGDLFDRKNTVDAVTFSEVYDRIAHEATNHDVWLLRGNHDEAAGGIRSSVEPFRHLPKVNVVESAAFLTLEKGFACAVLPYTEDPRAGLQRLASLGFAHCAALFTHVGIAGAKTGSEFPLPGQLSMRDFAECPVQFDHILCGHYHEPQYLEGHPHCEYVGSLLQRSFSDVGAPRRILLWDTAQDTWSPVLTSGPRFLVIPVGGLENLQSVRPPAYVEENAYIKVVTKDPQLTVKDVERLGWAGLGCTVLHVRDSAVPAFGASADGGAKDTWGDRFRRWVEASEAQHKLNTAEKESLVCRGNELLQKADLA